MKFEIFCVKSKFFQVILPDFRYEYSQQQARLFAEAASKIGGGAASGTPGTPGSATASPGFAGFGSASGGGGGLLSGGTGSTRPAPYKLLQRGLQKTATENSFKVRLGQLMQLQQLV